MGNSLNTARLILVVAISVSVILSMGSVAAISSSGFTADGNIGDSGNQMGKGISFIALCSANGVDQGDVIHITGYNFDEDGNPRTVEWETTVPVEAVVLKGGDGYDVFLYGPGVSSDTVSVGEGSSPTYDVHASDPCPPEMTGVKFEFDNEDYDEV